MSTIAEIVETKTSGHMGSDDRNDLVAALVERENAALDMVRVAGMNFGLFPQIVAEVLAESGLGTPLSEDERAMIHTQYVTLIQHLQEGGH
jgi:hypothetical protein